MKFSSNYDGKSVREIDPWSAVSYDIAALNVEYDIHRHHDPSDR